MKTGNHSNDFSNRRVAFCEWYSTAGGQMLMRMEAGFLSRSMCVSYKALILQLGSLGWEDQFLDADLLRNFIVVDPNVLVHKNTHQLQAKIQEMPVASESIDIVILPHTLEFEDDQHQVLREAERVLKPEGQLLLLGFNPWSVYGLFHYVPLKRKKTPWCGNFISRHRVIDWLRLLNFKTESIARFCIRSSNVPADRFENRYASIMSLGYALKAIKRRYTLIPLSPAWVAKPRLITVEVVETCAERRING